MAHMAFLVVIPPVPWYPRKGSPWSAWTPAGGLLGLSVSLGGGLLGPPGGGSSDYPGDSGFQGPPRQLVMWQNGPTLDESIADMNRSLMQLLTAKQTTNAQLQLQPQWNQAVQIAHTAGLTVLAESTQHRNFNHLFLSIQHMMGPIKKDFSNG